MSRDEQNSMREFSFQLQVRWSECDPAGVVYYPNYFTYVETALFAYMNERGFSWGKLIRELGLHFPRIDVQCRYIAPVTFGDSICVHLFVLEIRTKVLTLGFTMERQHDRRLIAEGYIKFAAIPATTVPGQDVRAVKLPQSLLDLFAPITQAEKPLTVGDNGENVQ